MKNKLKLILVGIISLLLVTGCGMKTNIHMDIKSNKDVNVSMTIAMDDELIDAMISTEDETKQGNVTDADRWTYLEKSLSESSDDMKDWKSSKYDKDGYKGYTYTSKTLKLDDLTGDKKDKKYDFFGEEEIDKAKLFVKTSKGYKSNFSGDMSNDSSLGSSSSYSSQMSLFEVTFSVTLPSKPISHNATSVSKDGKTLTWDLTKESNIEFEFSTGPNYLLYGGIAVLVIVIIVVIVLVSKSSHKNSEPAPVAKEEKPTSDSNPVNQPTEEPKQNETVVEENSQPIESAPEAKEEAVAEAKDEVSLQDMYNSDAPSKEDNQDNN